MRTLIFLKCHKNPAGFSNGEGRDLTDTDCKGEVRGDLSRVGAMSRPRRAMFQRRVSAVGRAVDRPGVFVGRTACGKQKARKRGHA